MSRQPRFLVLASNSLHVGKERREQGHIERKKRVVKNRKIPLEELKAFVEAHLDAFLREIAAHFDCAVPSVWAALKQIKVTLKKDDEL
ncbi:transposase [Streptococcus pneumoniae]|nr:transposase [Streptococcus pneumoniae WU2] [Streptococcus pneumoniae]VTQ38548.1 Transposase [Haemophilus haemolyticus]OKQ29448.1 transposase [Streptococcus pneumoniae]OKQ45305.1 transposase [Streptococcus pneumoniae]OKQ48722.1 transposase [Streptococcus pneumoniae]